MIDSELIALARGADLWATAKRVGAILRRVTATELAGPCPKCGGRDRFAVNVKLQVWNCRGCGKGGNALDLVMHVNEIGFREAIAFVAVHEARTAPARVRTVAEPSTNNGDNGVRALALWRESVDPRVPLAELYLSRRGLELDDGLVGEVLRWHPRAGAMVALFRNILTGSAQAVSRTFLDHEGKKLGRRFLGPVWGAAVMLDAFDEVLEGLHVGEGVETCMSARQLGLRPCWALGSAPAVAAFPVLGGVECLTLLQENDPVSERACEASAARWHAEGREVFINQPTAGKDLNDTIRGAP